MANWITKGSGAFQRLPWGLHAAGRSLFPMVLLLSRRMPGLLFPVVLLLLIKRMHGPLFAMVLLLNRRMLSLLVPMALLLLM